MLRILAGVVGVAVACAVVRGATTGPTTAPPTAPASLPTTRGRLEVPGEGEQAAMEKLVKELYKVEYGKKGAGDRKALAGKLLQQARETRDNAAARYVLLREARDLAVAAGDVGVAVQAIDEISGAFEVDGLEMRVNALEALHGQIVEAAGWEALVGKCLSTVDLAVEVEDYSTARRLVGLADGAAGKSKRVALVMKVQEAGRELAGLEREHERYVKARETLKTRPEDAEARLVMGQTLCFMKGDWAAGLEMLAGSSDEGLAELARKDLAARGGAICEPAGQLALGHAWWEVAQGLGRVGKARVEGRAGYWYRRALPGLTGLDRQVAAARGAAAAADPALAARLRPGLVAEIFSGVKLELKLVTRIDAQVNYDWGKDGPGEGLPKDEFSMRWSGWVKVSRGGKYTFVVQANSGARLVIDGATVIDEDKVYQHRTGVKGTVDLREGVHAIRVEFWDTGGTAKMMLEWVVPGEKEARVVPAEALGHEETAELAAELNKGKK